MSGFLPPFDDTVLLENMPVTESDTAPIVENEETGERILDGTPDTQTVQPDRATSSVNRKSAYITVFTLLIINLLNYMDRFTVAGKESVVT